MAQPFNDIGMQEIFWRLGLSRRMSSSAFTSALHNALNIQRATALCAGHA